MSQPIQYSPFSPMLPARAGERLRWSNLHGSSAGLALCSAAGRHSGPVIVVTPDVLAAQRLEDELHFYLGREQALLPVLGFPDWETLPYDAFSPHQDIISQRLETLYRLTTLTRGVLIAPISTLMHRVVPRGYLDAHSLVLDKGDKLALEPLRRRLQAAGYRCVSEVMEHGEFAVRGGLADVFPMGSPVPYRIELFDDEVETIRTFDPESQRSIAQVPGIRLLPAREFPLDEAGITRFRQNWRELIPGDPQAALIYRDVSQGIAPAGIEYYLPLFFDDCVDTLFEYLPADSLVVSLEGTEEAAERFWREVNERFEQHRYDRQRPLLEPARLFLQANEVFASANRFPRVQVQSAAAEIRAGVLSFPTREPPQLPVDARLSHPLAALKSFLDDFGGRVLLAAESTGRREVLLDLLRSNGLDPAACEDWPSFAQSETGFAITVAPLEHGLVLEQPRIAVIAESQLFGERVMQQRRRGREEAARDVEHIVRDLAELTVGAPVVHEEHGVGRYQGLQTLEVDGLKSEFLVIEYAGGDKLYTPVASLHLVRHYSGADLEQAPLHRLGSDQWERARRKATEKVRDVAAELLEIHARRQARPGHPFSLDGNAYAAFAQGFPFEETPDQAQAIQSVLADMQSAAPMDRLVCGDVGFGKTEVALRAAFVAVHEGRQVAVLVPTTLLAQQHYQTFLDRFADWPVRVEAMSRFLSRKQQNEVLKTLAEGGVDIVIGTHRLLSEDVRFKHLGLIIVDEEHRFGVRHKERLKALRAEVDILTLTATPIPRTLNMALSGLRGLSVIATPPARRLAIKTFVREWDDTVVREALLREILRGGQVYFLHNEVETIDKTAREVEALVPEARVRIAHGQMRERELEQVMRDFYHQRFNVLVCTTIIESGIDIPTANTIVMHRADRLGLAQIHQLRGRVGRSHHRAYAYLIIPPRSMLTPDAVKRLEAVESLEDLGAGFTLAMHDLEIRGAGELLGEEQSGQIQEIGFSLYMEYLERAVGAMKSGRQPELTRPEGTDIEIDLHIPALLPEDYLPDVHVRLVMYKRIASAASPEGLRELQVEMIDRFGLLPPPAKNLFESAELKLRGRSLGIRKIDLGPQGGRVIFNAHPDIDPASVIKLIQTQPRNFKLEGQDRLRITLPLPDAAARLKAVDALLGQLRPSREAASRKMRVG